MRTIEVLPEEWERQLTAFSAIHRGGIVSLDVLEPTLPFQFPIHELPLVSVTADSDARESTITISAGHRRNPGTRLAIETRQPDAQIWRRTPPVSLCRPAPAAIPSTDVLRIADELCAPRAARAICARRRFKADWRRLCDLQSQC